ERLALVKGRVRRGAPPRRLDRPAAVGGHDEVDTLLAEALPELPPGGGAAVAEVEVDRGRDREDPGGGAHAGKCRRGRLRSRRRRWAPGRALSSPARLC